MTKKQRPDQPSADDPEGFAAYLARFSEWQRLHNYAEATVATRARLIEAFALWADARGIARPNEVTRPVLERYRRHLFHHRKRDDKPLAVGTQSIRLAALKAFFRFLSKESLILFNPASELDLPRQETRLPAAVLSVEEVEKVLALPDIGTPEGLRDRAILELLYATGMRRREATRLESFDIDYGRCVVMIRQGKGRKDRVVPLGERARAWLEKYRDEARPLLAGARESRAFFLNRFGAAFEEKRLTKKVGAYVRRADLGKSGACHLFRHTAATLMLEGGADIRFIQAMLGHEALTTTQVYTRVSIAKLAEIHAATHPGARLWPRQHSAADAAQTDDRAALLHAGWALDQESDEERDAD